VLAAVLAASGAVVGLAGLPGGCAAKLPAPQRPCAPEAIPPSLTRTKDACLLNIPDRTHEPGHPKEGWCGEVAIQEALLYAGAYVPQKHINRAGKPAHPDLYARDIPVALKNLGAGYDWADGRRKLPTLLAWLRKQLRAGIPVLAGVKIHPTKHPEWSLDHFVLVAGCDKDSFTFNTTWGKRQKRTVKQLASRKKGYAFANRHGVYYALRIRGPAKRLAGEVPVRLFVTKETKTHLDVIVKCESLTPGAEYVVSRAASFAAKPVDFAAFHAPGRTFGFRERIARSAPTVFRCRRE